MLTSYSRYRIDAQTTARITDLADTSDSRVSSNRIKGPVYGIRGPSEDMPHSEMHALAADVQWMRPAQPIKFGLARRINPTAPKPTAPKTHAAGAGTGTGVEPPI